MDTYGERGSVRPVSGDGDGVFLDPIEPTQRSLRPALMGGLVLAVLIVAAVALTVVWRGRSGDPFASARSVPASADYVMTFDALALSDSERLQAFVDAFAGPMLDAGLIDSYPDDLVAAIDDAMGEESGFTLSGDIVPWMGRSVSVAGTVPELSDPLGEGLDIDASFILSADVRDRTAADAFVDKLIRKIGEENATVTATEIGGQAGYRIADADEQLDVALVLLDDALLFGIEDTVASAIEARNAGLSIADDAGFVDTMSMLPSERMMSFYLAPSAMEALLDLGTFASENLAMAGMSVETPETADLPETTPMATAVSLVDEGLLFSYVVLGDTGMEGVISPDTVVLASLPVNTLGFMSVAGSDAVGDWAFDDQALADLGYPLDDLSEELGIDIGALIESLSGDLTIAATETRASSIADATDVPVGVVGALGLTDADPMSDLIEVIEEMFAEQGIDVAATGGVTSVASGGQDFLSYSVQDDVFVIGSGQQLVEDVSTHRDGGLLGSELYQELDRVVVGDGLIMFVDVAGVVSLVPTTSQEAAAIAPLRGVGFGGQIEDNATMMEVLFLIDY